MKRIGIISLMIFILGILAGFGISSFRSPLGRNEQGAVFEGRIEELAGSSARILIDDGFPIRGSGDRADIYLNEELQKEAAVGQRVRVRYDGMVQEMYPLQLAGQMGVTLLEPDKEADEAAENDKAAGAAKATEAAEAAEVASPAEQVTAEDIFFEKDGKQYQKVRDLFDGQYHWASAVSEGTEKLDSHGHKHVDYDSQTRWFECLEDNRRLEVRRWDNLRYSAGDYLIYDYDGVIHVARAEDLYHPVLSYDWGGTYGNISKVRGGIYGCR